LRRAHPKKAGAINFAHSALTEQRRNFVYAELGADVDAHEIRAGLWLKRSKSERIQADLKCMKTKAGKLLRQTAVLATFSSALGDELDRRRVHQAGFV
jgi:hypothetical protein